MAVGAGIGGQIGYVSESVYGTYVAPTRFAAVRNAKLKKTPHRTQSTGLAAGQLVDELARWVETHKEAGGDVELDVTTRWMGHLLQAVMGTTVTPVQQGATLAYLQTHTLADVAGKSLTVQAGVPNTAGTVTPFTYLGSKVKSAEFECGVGDLLSLKLDLDSQDVTEAQTLAAASFPASFSPLHFGQSTVKLGATVAGATSVTGVRKVTLKVDRGYADDRFYFGASGLKAEPITNERVQVTGTVETDFTTKADWADRFRDNTSVALVWTFVGPQIDPAPHFATLEFQLPAIVLTDETPQLDGPDVVKPSFPFKALFDGTNAALTITYKSLDSTL